MNMRKTDALTGFIHKCENVKAKNYINDIYTKEENTEYANALIAVILKETKTKLQYLISGFFIEDNSFYELLFGEERLYCAEKVIDMMCNEVKSCNKENKMKSFLKAVAYLDENLTDISLSVENAAGYTGVSSAMLSKLFKRYKGITPVDYIGKRRVEKSIAMLKEKNAAIKDIAYSVGFSSVESYIRTFKKFYMTTPGKWNKLFLSQK